MRLTESKVELDLLLLFNFLNKHNYTKKNYWMKTEKDNKQLLLLLFLFTESVAQLLPITYNTNRLVFFSVTSILRFDFICFIGNDEQLQKKKTTEFYLLQCTTSS